MKKAIITLIASIAPFISAPVLADDVAEDYTEYEFDDEVLVGELVGAEGVNIVTRPRGAERSLLRIRTHFIPRMLRSVEDI